MGRNRAEYMRSYRAAKGIKKAIESQTPDEALREARKMASDYAAKCNDLEDEVKHLKAELAKQGETTQALRIALNRSNADRAEAEALARVRAPRPTTQAELDRRYSVDHFGGMPRPAPKPHR